MLSRRDLYQVRIKSAYLLSQAPVMGKFALSCLSEYAKSGGKLSSESLEMITSRHILSAPWPDSSLKYFRETVRERNLSKWALPLSFFRLPNKIEQRALGATALEHHDRARKLLIRTVLPRVNKILDIGGAVDVHPEGALVGLGYPVRPLELHVVDLPQELRELATSDEPLKDMKTDDGVSTFYSYTGMQNLSKFADNSFPMVWSGQSIEHVTPKDAEQTFREVYRVLQPGGYFCLDTPNRTVTKLISDSYLHPDHKLEYTPKQLCARLEANGFKVEKVKAITPVPLSVKMGHLSKLEVINEVKINDDADNGFSFYVECRKP